MEDLLIRLLSNRIFIILVLLGLILLSVFFIYYFFIREGAPKETTPEVPIAKEQELSPSPTLPSPTDQQAQTESPTPSPSPLNQGEVKVASKNEASDPWLSPDGRSLKYLFKSDGTVYQINLQENKEEALVSFTPNLIKILWSPNGYHLINIFDQGEGKINKYSYDSITKENITLDPNFKFIAWSPSSDKIAYHYFDPKTEEGFVSVANADGKNWENLAPLLLKDLIVEWPSKNKISFYGSPPSNLTAVDLNIINPETTEPIQKILSSKYGLKTNWSPSGTRLLFSAAPSRNGRPKLFILNEALEEKSLEIEGMADKCAWSKSENYIYCALPQNLTQDINLPQDWYSNKFLSQDLLFKIDINSGEKTQITKGTTYDFSNLLASSDDSYLYFIGKESEFLYEVKL